VPQQLTLVMKGGDGWVGQILGQMDAKEPPKFGGSFFPLALL
jgi:hypothetical protein